MRVSFIGTYLYIRDVSPPALSPSPSLFLRWRVAIRWQNEQLGSAILNVWAFFPGLVFVREELKFQLFISSVVLEKKDIDSA